MKKKTAAQASLLRLCRGVTGEGIADELSGSTDRSEKDDRSIL